MVRGIVRKKIFRDNRDRDDFLTRLGKILPETSTPCYAWTLMPKHTPHPDEEAGNRAAERVNPLKMVHESLTARFS